jgi:hypothetical protein
MMMIFEEDAAGAAGELCIVHLFKPCSLFDAHFLPISLCEELKLLDHLRALNMYDLVCLASCFIQVCYFASCSVERLAHECQYYN